MNAIRQQPAWPGRLLPCLLLTGCDAAAAAVPPATKNARREEASAALEPFCLLAALLAVRIAGGREGRRLGWQALCRQESRTGLGVSGLLAALQHQHTLFSAPQISLRSPSSLRLPPKLWLSLATVKETGAHSTAHLFSASQISLGWLSSLRREVMADSTLADFWVANSERVACSATHGWHSAMCEWQTASGWPAQQDRGAAKHAGGKQQTAEVACRARGRGSGCSSADAGV